MTDIHCHYNLDFGISTNDKSVMKKKNYLLLITLVFFHLILCSNTYIRIYISVEVCHCDVSLSPCLSYYNVGMLFTYFCILFIISWITSIIHHMFFSLMNKKRTFVNYTIAWILTMTFDFSFTGILFENLKDFY